MITSMVQAVVSANRRNQIVLPLTVDLASDKAAVNGVFKVA